MKSKGEKKKKRTKGHGGETEMRRRELSPRCTMSHRESSRAVQMGAPAAGSGKPCGEIKEFSF